jgi:oligopeptide/dipeptide ABC transporter ATP-binding protein
MTAPLLEVRDLRVAMNQGRTQVLRGVDFDLAEGRTLCLVGESGSGKSVTAAALMDLLPPHARINATTMTLGGRPLAGMRRAERDMAMIFQDPMTSLNPVLTIGYQLREALQLKEKVSNDAAHARVLDVMRQVRIPDPATRLAAYPHQLSGGMRQRVMIAMALIRRPRLLIADEPTTALDVTVQAQILWLLQELQRETGTAILFITHDLGVVAEVAHDVAVMYAGRIVERGPVGEIFRDPAHPYTAGLMAATLDRRAAGEGSRERLVELPGTVPVAGEAIPGCAFAPRCAYAVGTCVNTPPEWRSLTRAHGAACPYFRAPQMAEGMAQ